MVLVTRTSIRMMVARHVTLIAALAIIPMLWYGNGLISGIGLDLQLTPRSFLEDIFYGWQSRHSLGTASNAAGWVFPSTTYFTILSSAGLPDFVIVRSWYALVLFLAGIAMYTFVNYLLKNYFSYDLVVEERGRADYRLGCALVGAIGYIANPYVVMHFDNGHFLIPYAILPIQLLIVDKGLRSGSLYYATLLALTSVLVTTNLPIVLINYVVIVLFAFWYMIWIDKHDIAKKVRFMLTSIFLIGLNLLWYVAPSLLILLNNDQTLAGAMDQESWVMYGSQSSFSETLRLLGIWALYGANDNAGFYLDNTLGIVVTYLLPIISLLPLIIFRKKELLYFPALLILFALFMAVGGHATSPFKPIYVFFYENMPLFPIFRNGYKFVSVIAFSYVILISVFLFWLTSRSGTAKGESRAKYYRYMVITIFLISALPLFRGSIFNEKNLAHVPSYWKDAAMWLNEQQGQFRVVLFPDQYFDIYKWGAWGGFMASAPYVSQDMVFNSATKNGNEIIQALYYPLAERSNPHTRIFEGDIPEDAFCSILPLLNVRYIIQRNDIDTSVYAVSRPKETKRFLDAQKCIEFRARFGELDIYEMKRGYLPRIYVREKV